MVFTRKLHAGIKQGDITQTVRFWKYLRVKVGGRYPLGEGWVIVNSIWEITLEDITPELARQNGFLSVPDLLKTAIHGSGKNIYLINFTYEEESK